MESQVWVNSLFKAQHFHKGGRMTSDSGANVSHDAKDSGNRVMEGLKRTKYSQNKTTQERQHSLKEMKVKIKLLTLMKKKKQGK